MLGGKATKDIYISMDGTLVTPELQRWKVLTCSSPQPSMHTSSSEMTVKFQQSLKPVTCVGLKNCGKKADGLRKPGGPEWKFKYTARPSAEKAVNILKKGSACAV